MNIKFGLSLDGLKPYALNGKIGEKQVGPLGMLAILETQLGLPSFEVSHTTRIIEYLSCLKSNDNINRFYHASLAIDEFNVASTLLQWRDNWYEANWNGVMSESVPKRLSDLAEVEAVASSKVSLCLGQRLQRVLKRLEQQSTQIEKIILLNPLSDFTFLWQEILGEFQVVDNNSTINLTNGVTDLITVKQSLHDLSTGSLRKKETGEIIKTKLSGDDSFIVLRAKSKDISSRYICQWLASEPHHLSKKHTALLAEDSSSMLDEAMELAHLPRIGFTDTSNLRPALQILSIVLDLLWEPLDPTVLLQFLMHPVGPLPHRIRQPLAEVVSNQPGINGELWTKRLDALIKKETEREGVTDNYLTELKTDIAYWFDSERFDYRSGIPLTVIKQRTEKVSLWISQKLSQAEHDESKAIFAAAYHQSSDFIDAISRLSDSPDATISPEQLHYLLNQLTGSGTGIVDKYAESSTEKTVQIYGSQNSGSFYQPLNTVFWWDLKSNSSLASQPWSQQELQALAENDVLLVSQSQKLQQQAGNWLKPIYAAQDKLVLVIHEGEESHPIWDQISSSLEGWQEINIESTILENKAIPAFSSLSFEPPKFTPLPPIKRWWALNNGELLTKRSMESYSSLDNFFYSPYQWVFKYKARLFPGVLHEISDGNLLKGSLVHKLFENFFNIHPHVFKDGMEKDDIDHWLNSAITTLITQEGAVLLQPGRMIEKERFITTAKHSLHQLIIQCRAARIQQIVMEEPQESIFFGGKLSGYIDAKVINDQGDEAVIDIKWGGDKYRQTSLKDNKHLQLITYAYLRQQTHPDRKWTPTAFFIIESGNLLAQNNFYFPNAYVVAPDIQDNSAQIWQKMKTTYDWRRSQLDQGLIEMTISGTEPDDDSNAPEDGLDIPDTSDSFSDYGNICGWSN